MTVCDRIAVMDQGVIQQVGTPVELYDRPVNRFVAQFVGSVNLFAGEARPGRFDCALGSFALPADLVAPTGAADLAFRPHAVAFAAAAPGAGIGFEGVVESREFLGEFVRYEVRVGEALVVADRPHERDGAPLEPGHRVAMAVPARELRFIA